MSRDPYRLTSAQRAVLRFLSDKMEADIWMIADAVIGTNQSRPAQRAGCVMAHLRRNGLVMRLPELNAWRLTKEGREYVRTANIEQAPRR